VQCFFACFNKAFDPCFLVFWSNHMAGHTWGSSQSRLLAGIVGDGKTWAGLLGKRVKLFKPALLFALVMTYCTNSPQGAEACFAAVLVLRKTDAKDTR
jgi:hypothetical protein